ncbi:MAG: fibronectin type III domain-containing protein, partial [Rhodococcus sp.]|nr:fibronectin type III domain-containing protein [Rhodococcus sp. (in: high G+C Gram-positive bacteria)]
NDDGEGLWSLVGTGSTNKENNSAPSFNENDSLVTRDVDENTPAGENVDGPVTATDADTTTLTYGLEGPHADLFSFDTRSGQIRTKAPLNHEDARCGYVEPADPATATTCTYRVTVTVVDRAGGSDAILVNIEVDDRDEPPSAPARPTVRATEDSSTSLDVSWNAPDNTGPPITSYIVQYRTGSEAFSDDGVDITGTTAKISGDDDSAAPTVPWLSANTSYEVRVRAINAERTSGGPWSATGTGRTNRANHQPIFDDRPHTGDESVRLSTFTVSRRVDENTRSGQIVGRVFADDADNDRLTYSLQASADSDEARAEAAMFDIDKTTGQIRTKAGVTYNYEAITATDTCLPLTDTAKIGSDRCYTVTVEVLDGKDEHGNDDEDEDADDSITVKIGVRNRDEPPAVPTVTVTAPSGNTTLQVFWDARNTGPPITGYDVQYRKGGGSYLNDNCGVEADDNCDRATISTDTSTTILALEEDTSYSVRVRATNDEGTSAWSSAVTLKTNKDTNVPPTFNDGSTAERAVDENKSSTDVGLAVNATDSVTNVLTYRLEGRDAASFTINSSTGQIRTRSALNHEDPACGYVSTATPTACTYTVRLKVEDGGGGSVSIPVTITVTDVDEPPSAPSAPRVTATKDTGWSLDVTWNEPRDTGKPPITDYDIQYREVKTGGASQDDWELWPHGTAADSSVDNTARSAKITRRLSATDADPLKPRTQYEVRVRAKNGEPAGDGANNWSSVGRGTTGPSNSRPSFDRDDAFIELRVDENTRAGQSVGSAVSASDVDSNPLRYSLEGPGADSFTILSSSGQIRTKSPLDFETRQSYSLTVKVDDGQKRKNSVAAKSVTITVDNVIEQPSAPAAPRVVGIPGSTVSVRVTWDVPANTGPPVKEYEVHYRESGAGTGFMRWTHYGVDRSTIITGLKAGTRYEVQVRARTDEGTSDWSRSGTGMPNPDVANRNPTFTAASRSLSVAENTAPNTDVGAPIAATDRDGDVLTYTLEGTDAGSFDILSTSDGGQIRTSAALNHEEKASYAVTVRVRDGRGGTDAVNITIRVTDVDNEAPDTPFAPTVTAVSSTRLQVTWDAPANTGPPITDYDYRYREPGGSWSEVTNTTITATTLTIEGLAASTSYDVEVRATNAEGTSDWSNPGIGATNAPGANNPPVFDEGATATRTVSASAQAGASIGLPVTATDADSVDTVTYSLEGRDAGLFDINGTSGQLLTKSGISLITGETYTVIVTADDQTDVARITVSIEVTAAPPNNPPVFSQGPSTTLTVRDDAASGANIGSPVTATDADAGDTITYSLEGTDAASFDIVASSGQIQASAALDASTKSTYSVTVRATDSRGGSATIAVTITVTALPASFGCATNGAVSDASNTGLVSDCEALLRSRNTLEGSARLNWSEVTPIEDWQGVYLRGTPSRVTWLIIRS